MHNYREISLTQGRVAVVDAADYEWLSQWGWYAHQSAPGHWYARRKVYGVTGKRLSIGIHRAIMDAPSGVEVDHINGDGLDNRRENLRLATRMENNHNRRTNRNNHSGFKGVSWDSAYQKWRVSVSFDGKQQHVGYYGDLIKAAFARDIVEFNHHGPFANLNFPEASHA